MAKILLSLWIYTYFIWFTRDYCEYIYTCILRKGVVYKEIKIIFWLLGVVWPLSQTFILIPLHLYLLIKKLLTKE